MNYFIQPTEISNEEQVPENDRMEQITLFWDTEDDELPVPVYLSALDSEIENLIPHEATQAFYQIDLSPSERFVHFYFLFT